MLKKIFLILLSAFLLTGCKSINPDKSVVTFSTWGSITEINVLKTIISNFEKEIQNGLKLVDFYTTWCKYCQNQNEILKELSDNGMWIGKLDCDKHSAIAKKFQISGFPSFVLFKNGKGREINPTQ